MRVDTLDTWKHLASVGHGSVSASDLEGVQVNFVDLVGVATHSDLAAFRLSHVLKSGVSEGN